MIYKIDSIRGSIERSVCRFEGQEHRIQCSVGYSEQKQHTLSDRRFSVHTLLIRSANQALLQAKETGRNKTVEWESQDV